ncbi:MAG: gamma-glutamylcyclotransferase family protein, partial [Verrucomicrobiota bacterium]
APAAQGLKGLYGVAGLTFTLSRPVMNHNLFAYGTLMCEETLRDVTGKTMTRVKATLHGYRRMAVKDAPYPAVVPEANHWVEGVLYRDVPPEVWAELDHYEGEIYSRESVDVELHSGFSVRADVYVLRNEFRFCLDDKAWDPESNSDHEHP